MLILFGGYIIIGAKDGQGNLVNLNGVDLQSNFKQTVVQWCFDGIYPPVVPIVSQPIERPNTGKYLYIIFVEESEETPHFLNKRKGCYIRTDEYSQRFEPRLANLNEVEFLQNRRQKFLLLRQNLLERAKKRFETHVRLHYDSHQKTKEKIGATFNISLIPKFPNTLDFLQVQPFSEIINQHHISARGVSFPNGYGESQPDGFYFLAPRITEFAYLEVDMQGLIYYQQELRSLESPNSEDAEDNLFGLTEIFSWIMYYLRYSKRIYEVLGFNGTLLLQIILEGISGKSFKLPSSTFSEDLSRSEKDLSRLDDIITIDTQLNVAQLRTDKWSLLRKLFRELCFSCGYAKAYQVREEIIDRWIEQSLKFLRWKEL